LALRSPLIASSSPLTGSLDGLRGLESAGAGAVGLPSLFEEELAGGAAGGPGPAGGALSPSLSLVEQARAELSIPVIASLNGTTRGGWVDNAARLEASGAHALELNIYYVSTSPSLSAADVEERYFDLVRAGRRTGRIPGAVKLSPYFSATPHMARRLVA